MSDPDAMPRADCVLWGGRSDDAPQVYYFDMYDGSDCTAPSCDVPAGGGTVSATTTTSIGAPGLHHIVVESFSGAPGCPGDLGTYSDRGEATFDVTVT
jgi:hypothetical protein